MNVLITGASGLLGKKLYEGLSKTEEVAGTYFGNRTSEHFHHLDVSDRNSVDAFFEYVKPNVVIHTAALVNPDYCEENRSIARKINVDGTSNVVDACQKNKAKLVYLSSDYVFDGRHGPYTEVSFTSPVNFYGETKLEGERIVTSRLGLADPIIIRPAIMYGSGEGCKDDFISQVVKKLRSGENLSLDNIVVKYPTLTDDVSNAIKRLIDINAGGIYHVAGEDPVTRYQWAMKIAELYGLPTINITSDGSPGKAPRPLDVRLDSSKIMSEGFNFLGRIVEKGIEIVKNQKGCAFQMMYSTRPDMLVKKASRFRINIGKQLAKEQPADADIVVPIPESGVQGATGYSAESNIPLFFGLVRDYFTNRTLFEPSLKMRTESLEKKLVVVSDVVKDQRIVLIDEAIIAGTTLGVVVNKLKKANAKEIHIRIPSPPMIYNCENGVLRQDAKLIADKYGGDKEKIEEGLRQHFGVDSLRFLSLEGIISALPSDNDYCADCFKRKDWTGLSNSEFKEEATARLVRTSEVPDESREGGNYSIKRLFTHQLAKRAGNIGFYQTTIPPGKRVKNHHHSNLDEVLYFITAGKVLVGSKTFDCRPGDSLILPPKVAHEIVAEDREVVLIATKMPNIVSDKVNIPR